jgi:predicted enzyme related to lactoylglutathione lyase
MVDGPYPDPEERIDRRNILSSGLAAMALPGATILNLWCTPESIAHDKNTDKGSVMKIQYLEIVTTDVDAACKLYSQMHGVTFGGADKNLGGARTAKLADDGMLGIRAPLRDTEKPVVRPYVLVKDIKASVAAAAKSGAEIAMTPTKIAGHGQFAIVIHGGIETGLWQL